MMHRDDQMTPNERLTAFLTGQPMDRIMAMPVIVSMSGDVCGMTHREKRSSAENEAKAQIASYERFGNDLAIVEYGLHGVGAALGAVMSDPERQTPAILQYPLKKPGEVSQLDMARLELKNDPQFRLHLDAAKILKEKVGKEMPIGCLAAGPFTAATSCCPIAILLRETRKHPDDVHALLRFVTDGLKIVYQEFIKEGILILMCDPLASGTILSKKQYIEFTQPYATELMQFIHEKGGMVCYHICGDTTNTLEYMVQTGCDMVSVDNVVDMEFVKKTAGHLMPILGNVAPIDYFIFGDVPTMVEAVKRCLRKAWDSPNGYILASGCDLSGNVKLKNIDAFMNAARIYGKYPLDPKNFA